MEIIHFHFSNETIGTFPIPYICFMMGPDGGGCMKRSYILKLISSTFHIYIYRVCIYLETKCNIYAYILNDESSYIKIYIFLLAFLEVTCVRNKQSYKDIFID